MKAVILISLLSLVGQALGQVGNATDSEKEANYDEASIEPRHLVVWKKYDYINTNGQCCTSRRQGCRWRVYPLHWSYWSDYSRYNYPGYFYYRPSYNYAVVVACLCNHPVPAPTAAPPPAPTSAPTAAPTTAPTSAPTTAPTAAPTSAPTTAPTAAPALRFCPAGVTTKSTTTRILNGTPVNSCTSHPGVVSLVYKGITMCTGVVTSANTVSITKNCAKFLTLPMELREPISDKVIETLPTITKEAAEALSEGGAYVIKTTTTLTANSCPGIACIYTQAMANDIDVSKCVAVGAGYDTQTGANPSTLSLLKVPSLFPTADCKGYLEGTTQAANFDLTKTYNCFLGNGGTSTCVGDAGAAVMCPLTTGEMVVIGQVENMPCNAGQVVAFYNLEGQGMRIYRNRGSVVLG